MSAEPMKAKWVLLIGAAILVISLGVILIFDRPAAPTWLVLRLIVEPQSAADMAVKEAGGAKFKYLVGKESGVKPGRAQAMRIKAIPSTGVLEVQAGMDSAEEAQRYSEVLVKTLQEQCGTNASVRILEQTIR